VIQSGTQTAAAGLSNPEILRIVYRYIGVEAGYLGDFSYGSHAEFYPLYCNLDLNPFDYLREGRPGSGSSSFCRRARPTSRRRSFAAW
jgi:hypothetical protein